MTIYNGFRCSLWLTYGNLQQDNSIVLVNTIGSTLFFVYSLVYYVFTVNKILLLKQFLIAGSVLLGSLGYAIYETDEEMAKQTIGIFISVIFINTQKFTILNYGQVSFAVRSLCSSLLRR